MRWILVKLTDKKVPTTRTPSTGTRMGTWMKKVTGGPRKSGITGMLLPLATGTRRNTPMWSTKEKAKAKGRYVTSVELPATLLATADPKVHVKGERNDTKRAMANHDTP